MNRITIIIVEDGEYWKDHLSEDVETALRNISCQESYIECYETFEQAYKALKEKDWSLLITDIGIGGGHESYQKKGIKLVQYALKRNIPAIVVSGTWHLTPQNVRDLLIKDQASDFFGKDVYDSELFIKKVQDVLQTKDITGSKTQESPHIDFAIITALRIERESVCKAFGLTSVECRVKKGSRDYWRGRVSLGDNKYYEIVVAQAIDMANIDAALLTNDAIHHWQPGAILLVGISAGVSEEEALGDLIVGSFIYYYERGKQVPGGIAPECYMLPSDQTLLSRINSLPRWRGIKVKGKMFRPNIFQGVIASGEKVIADQAVRNEIKSAQRKIRALEMEGYGFSKAAWQCYEPVRHLVIRSICDRADHKKDDQWHECAAKVAAEYTKFFLKDSPLPPRNCPEA